MSIKVDLDNYKYSADELSKTPRRFSNTIADIQSVINGLDHKVLAYVREDLLDIKNSLNIMSKTATKLEEDILETKHKYELAEKKANQVENKTLSIVAGISGAAAGEITGGLVGAGIGGVEATNALSSAKVEESTGGFISNAFKSISTFVTGAISSVGNAFKKAGEVIKDTGAEVANFVSSAASKVASFLSSVGDFVWTGTKKVGASVANVAIGLIQGLAEFAEAIVDTCAIVGTAVKSIFTGLCDLGQWIYGKITGNEDWNSVTKEMWSETMDFVATTHVKDAFKGFFENTMVGQWLDTNAFEWFKSTGAVYQVTSGLGYVAGVVILTIATFGVGGAAVGAGSAATGAAVTAGQTAIIAGTAGFGRGAETSWSQGASLGEGLTYAMLNAGWEGLQFYVGAKIGAPGGYGDKIASKLLSQGVSKGTRALVTSGTRIVLDSLDGGIEGFVQPLLQSIYADGYYDDEGNFIEFTENDGVFTRARALFDDMGGWNNVLIQTAIGGGGSLLGEVGDLTKLLKGTPVNGVDAATATTTAIGTTSIIGAAGNPDVNVDLSPNPGLMTPAGAITDTVDDVALGTGTALSPAGDLDVTAPLPIVGDGDTSGSDWTHQNADANTGQVDLEITQPLPIVGDDAAKFAADSTTEAVDMSAAGDLDATAPLPIVGDPDTTGSGWTYQNADANTGKTDLEITQPLPVVGEGGADTTLSTSTVAADSATSASALALQEQAAKMANMDFSDIPSGKTIKDVAGDFATEHSATLYDDYAAYSTATAADVTAWRDALSKQEYIDPKTGKKYRYLDLIVGYTEESDSSPGGYALLNTINRALDGDPATFLDRLLLKDADGNFVLDAEGNATIRIYHAYGSYGDYTYDFQTGEIKKSPNNWYCSGKGLNLDGSVGTLTDLIDRVQSETAAIENALAQSPQKGNIIVGRGAGWNALERFGISPTDSAEEIYRKLTANGSTYRDAGFMSSTPEMGAGFMSGSPVRFIMEVNDGSSTGNFSLEWNALSEKEILINHGTEFDITSVRRDANGNVYIFLAEKVTPAFDGADLIDVKAFTDLEVAKKAGQEALDLRTEIEVEKAALDLADPNYAKKLSAIESKAKLETELLASIHSKGMTLEEYLAKCSEIPKFDPATTAIIQQQAKAIADKAASIEPGITSLMESLQDGNAHLVGLDYRFKSQSSIESKIARVMSNYGYSADIAGSQINDSLRYTLICDAATYSETVIAKLAKLKSEGYQIKYMNNAWGNSTYKGLNLTLTGPDGVDIELQFHTQASFDVKQTQNHLWYEISRSPNVDADVKALANQVQAMNQSIYNTENVTFNYGSYDIDVLNQDLDAYIAKNITPSVPQKTISIIGITEEHAFTKQIASYPEGYIKYKDTNLPADAVIDSISGLKQYGNTAEEALAKIEAKFGKDSIQYVTATGTLAQLYLHQSSAASFGGLFTTSGVKGTSDRILAFYDAIGIKAQDATQAVVSATGSSDYIDQSIAEKVCQQIFADSYNGWNGTDRVTFNGMKTFTGGSYTTINNALRTGDTSYIGDDLSAEIIALFQHLDNSPGIETTTLMYRGQYDLNWIANGALVGKQGQTLVDAINALGGGIYDIADNGFESSTPVLGQGFTGNCPIVEVTACPPGTKGAYIGAKSTCNWETEWLLNAGEGNKKSILGAELIDGKVYVYTQIVKGS